MSSFLKNPLAYIANILLGIIFAAGVAGYALMPYIVRFYLKKSYVQIDMQYYNTIRSMLYCAGIPILALLLLGFLLTLNITKNKAFVRQNTVYLNLISLCSLITAMIFFIFMFFMYSVFPIVLFAVFLLLALLTKIFADLFRTAINYKEENDLTI